MRKSAMEDSVGRHAYTWLLDTTGDGHIIGQLDQALIGEEQISEASCWTAQTSQIYFAIPADKQKKYEKGLFCRFWYLMVVIVIV